MTTILIKKKDTAGAPAPGDLTNAAGGAEIAVNTATKRLYTKDSGGTVVELGTNPSALTTNLLFSPDATYDIGASGATRPRNLFLSGAATLGTALATGSGGTGLASYTAGDLSYYASGTALTKLAIGTAGQILTSSGTAPQWSTLSGVAVTTFSAGTTGFTPSSATAGAVTLAGTLATTNGGTGLTSFTSGGVVYASSSSALATGSALTFNGTSTLTLNASAANLTLGISTSYGVVTATGTNPASIYFNGGSRTGFESHLQYFGANHTFLNETGGSEIMRLLNTGNVGIGTSAPTVKLDIVGAAYQITNGAGASGSRIRFETPASSGGSYVQMYKDLTPSYVAAIGTVLPGGSAASAMVFSDYQGSWVERMRITSAGDVGIGTAAPASKFDVRAPSSLIANYQPIQTLSTDTAAINLGGGLGLGGFYAGTTSVALFGTIVGRKENGTDGNYAGYLAFGTNAQATGILERMRITSTGSVGIGTSTPAGAFTIGGSGALQQYFISTSGTSVANAIVSLCNNGSSYSNLSHDALDYSWSCSGTTRFSIQGSGILTSLATYNNTSAGAANMFVQTDGTIYRSTSALKYKQDIRDLELIDINKFRAVRYKSKCKSDDQTIDYFGLIADDVDAAGVKELVTYGPNGEVENFQYDRFTMVLLKNLQSQKATIESLKARLDAANL